jgi:hypothetical protein
MGSSNCFCTRGPLQACTKRVSTPVTVIGKESCILVTKATIRRALKKKKIRPHDAENRKMKRRAKALHLRRVAVGVYKRSMAPMPLLRNQNQIQVTALLQWFDWGRYAYKTEERSSRLSLVWKKTGGGLPVESPRCVTGKKQAVRSRFQNYSKSRPSLTVPVSTTCGVQGDHTRHRSPSPTTPDFSLCTPGQRH